MISNKEGWLVIVNLHAGSKRCERDWPEIKELLMVNKLGTEVVFTKKANQAAEISHDYIENKGFKNIIIVGGDGTMNEVVNGVFRQSRFPTTDITLGLITVGTGNDWGRHYGMHSSYKKMVKAIVNGRTFVQDAGKVKYSKTSEKEGRYFVNIAGMGYDALVAKKTNVSKQKGRGGVLVYLINLLQSLFQYSYTDLSINADGEQVFAGKVFTLSIGVCKYNGGGMMQLPSAISDDGLFDVTLVRKTSRLKVIRNIKNLYDGSFIKMKEVETFRGKEFTINADPPESLFLEADGESLGHSPLFFDIVPKAIKLIVRKKFLKNLQG
ncbi:MAG: diacylglycerol kinase family lipid kinase [Chlorobi bacterium]|nr:diacylglycerol kinase family lipid kinase [Chlorobiota bacterium]